MHKSAYILAILLAAFSAYADDTTETCQAIKDNTLRLECYDKVSEEKSAPLTGTILDYRIKQEEHSLESSFSMTAHYPNYILPFAYVDKPNESPYDPVSQTNLPATNLDNLEVKFQVSFRVPINRKFFFHNSDLWFGYTQLSLWQLYNSELSAPFRETNYQPE